MVISRPWRVSTPDTTLVEQLAQKHGLSLHAASCLANRGFGLDKDLERFLSPQLGNLTSPAGMADLDKAVARTAEAIAKKQRIAVFGDYDVDGITSAAVVHTFLCEMGAATEIRVGSRFSGYGLSTDVVDDFSRLGCELAIVMDCGTRDHLAAKAARKSNLDLIVIDHHGIEEEHPDVHAFVNPQRADCEFGDLTLAAVGLAFYFVARLRTRLVSEGFVSKSNVDIRPLMDLVALGTVADVVPLMGNNRILVHFGLEQISSRRRLGIKSLIKNADIRAPRIKTDHIAFQLSPRLNAAGRMKDANEALRLLISNDDKEATSLATALEQYSKQRRVLEADVTQAAVAEARDTIDGQVPAIVAGDGWHRGVLGIVAARVAESLQCPCFAIGFEGDTGVGSARGHGQLDLHACLSAASSELERYGGHRDAAGFTIKKNNLEKFRELVTGFSRTHWQEVDISTIVCDSRLHAAELNFSLIQEIETLAPFGEGNPEPIFEIDGLYVLGKKVVGTDHLKLQLKTPSGTISAFGPRMAGSIDKISELICVAASVARDEWRGGDAIELRLAAEPIKGN